MINITSNGIKEAIDNLLNENELLQDKVYKLESIIKEVREYITYWHYRNDFRTNSFTTGVKEELLEILGRENNDK